eukprot:2681393-Amphidinium_carterae.1
MRPIGLCKRPGNSFLVMCATTRQISKYRSIQEELGGVAQTYKDACKLLNLAPEHITNWHKEKLHKESSFGRQQKELAGG